MMETATPSLWRQALSSEINAPYFQDLMRFVENERSRTTVYPPKELVFSALALTPLDRVKVVIVGQDPYHGAGQAHGLSFSVPSGTSQPPSLQNIFKEIHTDLGLPIPRHGCLKTWAEQGVLLLNATLTVRAGEPKSHYGQGWERFTDAIIAQLEKSAQPLVFMLWGRSAQEKVAHLQNPRQHLVLKAAHPSPFSAYQGFFGCRHFSKANAFLASHQLSPIEWGIS